MKHLVPHAVLVLCAVLVPAAVASSQVPGKIPVFVKAAATAGGFSDPSKERQDSVKDIQEKVRGSKVIAMAQSENEAVVIVEVLARSTRRETNFWGRQNKSRLEVRLTAGEYSTEFGADGGSAGVFTGYGKAAGSIVKQMEKWVGENRERLLALKK